MRRKKRGAQKCLVVLGGGLYSPSLPVKVICGPALLPFSLIAQLPFCRRPLPATSEHLGEEQVLFYPVSALKFLHQQD